MGTDRKAMREMREKIRAYDLNAAELERTKQTLIFLRDNSRDPRVRLNACKELRDGMFNIFEHENPVVQKAEVTHNFPTKLSIQVKKVGA